MKGLYSLDRRSVFTFAYTPLPRRRQGAMADGALRLPPCPQRLPLLFPKSSSILFGSPVTARQGPRGKPCREPSSEQLFRSRQDPSTNARDDKDGFCFQRSFDARGLCPRLLRMTESGSPFNTRGNTARPQDDRRKPLPRHPERKIFIGDLLERFA